VPAPDLPDDNNEVSGIWTDKVRLLKGMESSATMTRV
jgi:hypothetical protein